jgi:UDP-N-acetylmuramoyl-L-alanyl-D-glutamate--2,6-diaminopimelate ligase
LHSVELESAAFTNVATDHLDYHKSVEAYLNAKLTLFREILPTYKQIVASKDDAVLFDKIKRINKNIISCGFDPTNDLYAYNIKQKHTYSVFDLRIFNTRFKDVRLNLFGLIQVKNVLFSVALAIISGLLVQNAEEIIFLLKPLDGRLECLGRINGGLVFIDYAHTAEGFLSILKEFKTITSKRLIVVFGCGGDRDKSKRPLMGQYASEFADIAIVTDDNPRTECPEQIRKEITSACPNAIEIKNREEAIKYAIDSMQNDDIVLIAGKGHEKMQIYRDKIIQHNDKDVVQRLTRPS